MNTRPINYEHENNVKDSSKPESINTFGSYELRGIKKVLFNWAQNLPKNKFGFKIALLFRKITLQNRIETVDVIQFGLKLRLHPLQNLGDRFLLFMPRFFNYDEFRFMSKYLKPDSTFIDIGGNIGIFSLVAAKYINKSGRILTFEPNPILMEWLRFNVDINNFEQKIEPYQIGIADEEKYYSLSVGNRNLGGASIVLENGEYNIMIKCRPLLDVIRERNIQRIDILKIDIELAEPLALNPFFEKAPKELYPKIIFIESVEGINLEKLGYKLVTKSRPTSSIYKLE